MSTVSLSYQLLPTPALFMASPPRSGTGPAATNQTVLQLTASNLTAQPVTLTYLKLALPLGAGAADLLDLGARPTLAQLQAVVAPVPDPAWTLAQTSIEADAQGQLWASYLLHPRAGGTLAPGASWTFGWQGVAPGYWGIPVNTVPGGPVGFLLTEGQAGGPAGPELLQLTKVPANWFEPAFSADAATVASGSTVALTWNGPAGATYSLNALGPGAPSPLPNAGTYASVPLTHDTVFTLDVHYTSPGGQPHHATVQQVVGVLPVVGSFTGVVSAAGSPPQVLLSWEVTPPDAEVTIAGIGVQFTAQGSWPVPAAPGHDLPTSFTLTATNKSEQTATAQLVASSAPVVHSPIDVAPTPFGLAITPSGSQAWVSNTAEGTFTAFDTTTFRPVGSPQVGSGASILAFTPDGRQAWVANAQDNTVVVIDPATFQPVGSPLNLSIDAIAFTPDGSQAWVVHTAANAVTVIDTATRQPIGSPIAVAWPIAIAITPDGRQAWIVNTQDNLVTAFDTATCQPVGSPMGVAWPIAIAITPDGRQAWVASYSQNSIYVLDTATYSLVGSPIAVGTHPWAIAFTPDGHQGWIANMKDGTVTIVDTATHLPIGGPLAVGSGPGAIAITPNGRQVWVANTGNSTVSPISIGISSYERVPPTETAP